MTEMTPKDLLSKASLLLEIAGNNPGLPKDPAQMAAVLKTAAEACTQVHGHNMLMAAVAKSMSS